MKKGTLAVAALAAAASLALASSMVEAKAAWVKKAKDAGIEVKDCTHCHVAKGKKDLNEVGQWLVKQKEEKKAAEVDVAWLKEYKPAN